MNHNPKLGVFPIFICVSFKSSMEIIYTLVGQRGLNTMSYIYTSKALVFNRPFNPNSTPLMRTGIGYYISAPVRRLLENLVGKPDMRTDMHIYQLIPVR